MHILAINTGQPGWLKLGSKEVPSGIAKLARQGRVRVSRLGVDGDHIANLEAHGGPDQAVYLYRSEDYAWWTRHLDIPLEWGRLGENLTVAGLPPDLCIGDLVCFGEVQLQITAPRIPCAKLAVRLERPDFVKTFAQARRPGAYARVLTEGYLETGMSGSLERYPGESVEVAEVLDLFYEKAPDPERLGRARRTPLAERAIQGLNRMHGPADYLALSYSAPGPEDLRQVYQQWAASYDRDLEKLGWDKPARLGELLEQLGCPRGRTLDAGAGTGWMGAELQRRGWTQVEAIDFSPAMLEQARARGCYHQVWQGDVSRPLELGPFDLVVAVGLFTQGHAPASALENLLQTCRSGGWLAFSLRDDLLSSLGYARVLQHWEQEGLAQRLQRRTYEDGLGGHPWSLWLFRREEAH